MVIWRRAVPALVGTIALISVAVVGWAGGRPSPTDQNACDRACLKGLIDRYLAALVAHDPSQVPTTSTVRFTENSKRLPLGDGAWKTATGMGTFRIDFADLTQ